MSRLSLVCGLFGLGFGAVFAAAGFNQYDVIHEMLLLRNLEPGLTMASAVGTAFLILRVLEHRKWRTPLGGPMHLRRWDVERKHVLGGMVFGTGWAITGACPGTASTMIGGGSVLGIVLAVGVVAGITLRDMIVTTPQAAPVAVADPMTAQSN